jgi:ABC-type dipeptide/oligopeptide/nickel transport system permease component
MRIMAVIVVILGIASLVLGILFIVQSGSAKQEVADTIAPLPLAQLDEQYDSVTAQYEQMKAADAPKDATYNYVYGTKVGLGLARSNVGTANFVMMSGIVALIIGVGLVLSGIGQMKKA